MIRIDREQEENSMVLERNAETNTKNENYSVEELENALTDIFDSTDLFTDSQVEEMDAIMAVLTKKNPLPHGYTAEESWKVFKERYSEELSRLGLKF